MVCMGNASKRTSKQEKRNENAATNTVQVLAFVYNKKKRQNSCLMYHICSGTVRIDEKKKVKKKKVSWLAPRPREKKRKEKPPLCLERTVAQEWPELELFFFRLVFSFLFPMFSPGGSMGIG